MIIIVADQLSILNVLRLLRNRRRGRCDLCFLSIHATILVLLLRLILLCFDLKLGTTTPVSLGLYRVITFARWNVLLDDLYQLPEVLIRVIATWCIGGKQPIC